MRERVSENQHQSQLFSVVLVFFLLNTFKIVSPDMIMSKCTMRRNLAQRTLASSLILDKKQIKKLNKKPKTTKIPTLQ